MAPDLNSLPPSPHSPRQSSSISRRTQESNAPLTIPISTPTRSPVLNARDASSFVPQGDNTGVGLGPGPLRHPRPLTAADLHMQLEKEQEAVVNRLTRELSLLRQQTASVASTTSSASVGLQESTDQNPIASQRHRSSSSLSGRNSNVATTGTAGSSSRTLGTTAGIAGSTVSGIAPARDSTTPYSHSRDQLSRQSSIASRQSETSSPSLSSSLYQGDHSPNLHGHRHTGSASHVQAQSQGTIPGSNRSSYIPATQRYEEAAHHRSEFEAVKRENETLRRRVRELERGLNNRRESGSRRESMSVHTSAPLRSSPIGAERQNPANAEEGAVIAGVAITQR
ncbi:hypothetical protein ACLMJK_004640 [Lecanora helva]